jgi:hypothetical protein
VIQPCWYDGKNPKLRLHYFKTLQMSHAQTKSGLWLSSDATLWLNMATTRPHRYHSGCWLVLTGQLELAPIMTIGGKFLKPCLCIQTYAQTGVIITSLVYYYMSWIFLVVMVHCNFVNKWLTTPRPNVMDHLRWESVQTQQQP